MADSKCSSHSSQPQSISTTGIQNILRRNSFPNWTWWQDPNKPSGVGSPPENIPESSPPKSYLSPGNPKPTKEQESVLLHSRRRESLGLERVILNLTPEQAVHLAKRRESLERLNVEKKSPWMYNYDFTEGKDEARD